MPSSTVAEADHLNRDLSSGALPGASTRRKRGSCSPGIAGTTCSRCEEQNVDCTYSRPVKRRGPPVRGARRASPAADDNARAPAPARTPAPAAVPASSGTAQPFPPASGGGGGSPAASQHGRYPEFGNIVKPEVIEGLVNVYYHVVYPLKPVFHWPTFYAQVQQQLYRSDWGMFVVTMAVCALTAGRLYSGVPLPRSLQLEDIRSKAVGLSSQCYSAAVEAMPREITTAINYYQAMRASHLLASVCLQDGQLNSAVTHLSNYNALSTMCIFHLESSWPADLSEIDRQERRRLFWAAYQQDQYLAINFGLPSRQREAKTTVLYPAEVFDDEDVTAATIRHRPDRVSFLRGWNYCTDLYRLFENMDTQMRAWHEASEEEPGGTLNGFLSRARQQSTHHFAADILHLIATLHRSLPLELKTVKAMTGDPRVDRHGFIATNILFATNNLKMLLVGAETSPNVHLRCAIAGELLDELGSVPASWFRAASSGSLHHIAHVGHVLGSSIKDRAPLSSWSYLQVRNILLILADFLEKLEASRSTPSANPRPSLFDAKLQAQIGRIDRCMEQTRQSRAQMRPRPDTCGLVPLGQGVLTRMNTPPPAARGGSSDNSNDNNINGGASAGPGPLSQPVDQQQVSPPHSAGSIASASCGASNQQGQMNTVPSALTIPPSIPRITRLLGADMGDGLLGNGPPDSSALGGSSNEFGFVNDTFDLSQQSPLHNLNGPDLVFPSLSNASLPADYFDGWHGRP